MRVHIIPAFELAELRKLNLLRRLTTHHGVRHTTGVLLGTVIVTVGSMIAHQADYLHATVGGPGFAWDAFGYSVHGFGLVPILKHLEAFWDIIMP
jgi:hypothetical protein